MKRPRDNLLIFKNVSEQYKDNIYDFFQVVRTENHGTYLGLPSFIGRNKKKVFAFIKDKVWKQIQGWRKRSLSKAGKEILLKTVVHVILMYVMTVFLLPSTLCTEVERMMNAFWGGKSGSNSRSING